MTFGLTPTGFVPKQIDDIVGELNADFLAGISTSLNLTETALVGILIGIFAEREANLWQLVQAVNSSQDPDQAEDAGLVAVSALTGTLQDAATKSLCQGVIVTLDATTTLPAGSIAAVDGNPQARFVSKETVISGIAGNYAVDFEGEITGPTVANFGTLTVIAGAVAGWTAVTNPADALLGQEIETNTHLRQKREEELSAAGVTTADAIRADILAIAGIAACTVFLNDTSTTDANGLPPHSVEVLIHDPIPLANNLVAQAVWNAKGAGIETHGTSSGTAIDTEGVSRTMFFSRVTIKNVYLIFDVVVNSSYPVAGDSLVQTAVALYGQKTYNAGDDVILAALYPSVFSIAGVTNITSVKAGFSASPSGTADLTIGVRELADLDTSRITVNS